MAAGLRSAAIAVPKIITDAPRPKNKPINRCIAKVRHIAESAEPPPFAIETIPRVGYRLRASLMDPAAQEEPAAPPEAPALRLPEPVRRSGRLRAWPLAAAALVEVRENRVDFRDTHPARAHDRRQQEVLRHIFAQGRDIR